MFYFMNFVCSFVNHVIFRELCDRMRFEVDCAKSHHRVIIIRRPELQIYCMASVSDFNKFGQIVSVKENKAFLSMPNNI